MTEKELYRSLGDPTRGKEDWRESIPYVASLLENQSLKITAKALWLLGEMGLQYPAYGQPQVRLAFIWASENIATTTHDACEQHLPLFAGLLHDNDDKVRMEAPEMISEEMLSLIHIYRRKYLFHQELRRCHPCDFLE